MIKKNIKIGKEILDTLKENENSEDDVVAKLDKIVKKYKAPAYPILFKILAHLDIDADNAKKYWKDILKHREKMNRLLDRDVGIRVPLLDYLINIDKKLTNPKIIEISLYEETEKKAVADAMTGLYNYEHFKMTLKREVEISKRTKIPLSLLFMDVDNFKNINDTYGHLFGDQVLLAIAKVLIDNLRIPDTICRYGGEEFAVICPNTDKFSAYKPSERIRKKIKDLKFNENISVTICIGIAEYSLDANTEVDLVKKADSALYQAKFEGKDQTCIFSTDRRKFFRMDLDCPITFETLYPYEEIKKGVLKNISEGGLGFRSLSFIEPGTLINLYIEDINSSQIMEFPGKIIRSVETKLKYGNKLYKYDIGLEFVKLTTSKKKELKRLLKKMEK